MNFTQQILVVDDDADIREVLRIQLENKGYLITEASNGEEAITAVANNPEIDLIILDIMMPGLSGIDACKKIRLLSSAPVLFLTAKSKESDKKSAYENGGDDYLVKPFSQAELLMKVHSLLRRYVIYKGKSESTISVSEVHIQDLVLDITGHCAYRQNQKIELTDTEFMILMYLVNHKGTPKDAQSIYEGVWGDQYLPSSTNTIMVHILKLRKKLELDSNDPTIIRTVWGKGYQIDEI